MRLPTNQLPRLAWLALLGLIGFALAFQATPAAETPGRDSPAVEMAPFEIKEFRGSFDYAVRLDEKTGALKAVAVTWISPAIEARGVRVGDVVSAINGRSVVRLSVDDVYRLLKHELAEGEVQLITFTGVRGFFRKSNSVIVRFTRPSGK